MNNGNSQCSSTEDCLKLSIPLRIGSTLLHIIYKTYMTQLFPWVKSMLVFHLFPFSSRVMHSKHTLLAISQKKSCMISPRNLWTAISSAWALFPLTYTYLSMSQLKRPGHPIWNSNLNPFTLPLLRGQIFLFTPRAIPGKNHWDCWTNDIMSEKKKNQALRLIIWTCTKMPRKQFVSAVRQLTYFSM